MALRTALPYHRPADDPRRSFRDPGALSRFPEEEVLRAFLRLVAQGREADAARALDRVRELRGGEPDDNSVAEEEGMTFLHASVRELAALSALFPEDLKRELAAATADPQEGRPGDLMHAMVMERPAEARIAAGELETRAPTLHDLYGHMLSGPGPDRNAAKRWLIRLGVVLLVLGIPRLARDCSGSRQMSVENLETARQNYAQQSADEVIATLDARCTSVDPEARSDCALGYALLGAYVEERCGDAGGWLAELQRQVEAGEAEHLGEPTLSRLRSLDLLVCGYRPR